MTTPVGTRLLIGAFATSGVLHMVKPDLFEPMIPPQLGPARPWVYGSGVVELVCAGGLATSQPWAPVVTTATLAAVWVGNIQMAVNLQRSRRPPWQKAAAWARIPLQVPMMAAAWRSPRRR
ncbi:MAG: hypothetical protein QG597_1101 [Actinomycetota bacterium]|nr:hypothetical protein [Actinomycetota bacterium]